jgi:hypothetical protein
MCNGIDEEVPVYQIRKLFKILFYSIFFLFSNYFKSKKGKESNASVKCIANSIS